MVQRGEENRPIVEHYDLINSKSKPLQCFSVLFRNIKYNSLCLYLNCHHILVEADRILLGGLRNEAGLFEWQDGTLVRDGYAFI